METQFTPNKDFFSEELQSQYCVGLSYTAKDDADHAELAELVPKWISRGLVRAGAPAAGDIAKHQVSGAGTTK
ncbi:MAG TPA: hypothetical protein VLH12_08795 [Usitatibacter sp.]|nr:hypothetical protein [Usitatibacter sp.]